MGYNIKDCVCLCLGLCDSEAEFIDELYDDFECSCINEEETMISIILKCNGDLKNHIINCIYNEVINRAHEEYGINEDNFLKDVNSICSNIYYKGEEFESWKQLVEIIEKEQEE